MSAAVPDCRFEVALSYASDNKKLKTVRRVAQLLQAELGSGKVFFDKRFKAELGGKDGPAVLEKIYRTDSLLVVPCICNAYNEKRWPRVDGVSFRHSSRTCARPARRRRLA